MTTEREQPAGMSRPALERPLGLVRGTRDWLPADHGRLAGLQVMLIQRFRLAGYEPMGTPILEFAELHERKSGAGIVSKLDELADERGGRICLRPELTASIVRAYVEAPACPPLPWRVSLAGPVFRHQTIGPWQDREFTQVGVERLGDGGPHADAELLGLADWALKSAGIENAQLRIGHVGLILEMLDRSGLPHTVRSALVEVISEAAASGRDVRAVESALERLSSWLLGQEGDDAPGAAGVASTADELRADRLFRHLVPDVTGRRTADEIMARLRRKWDMGHSLRDVLSRLSDQVHALASLRGPAAAVADRLRDDFKALAPHCVAELLELVALLDDQGLDTERIELDLGFARGLGFYTQMIFELLVPTSQGMVEVCGGGRYDGLARVLGGERDDRGAGFAFGLERLDRVLNLRERSGSTPPPDGFLVVAAGKAAGSGTALPSALPRLVNQIRGRGLRAVLQDDPAGEWRTLAQNLRLRFVLLQRTDGRYEAHDLGQPAGGATVLPLNEAELQSFIQGQQQGEGAEVRS